MGFELVDATHQKIEEAILGRFLAICARWRLNLRHDGVVDAAAVGAEDGSLGWEESIELGEREPSGFRDVREY